MLNVLALTAYALALAAAAASDLFRYQIPNALSLVIAGAFALAAFDLPLATTAWHLSAGIVVFAITATLFHFGILGGGDVKLMAATTLWMGWHELFAFVAVTAIVGGVIAAGLLLIRRAAPSPVPADRWYARLLSPKEGVPYGIAISASGLFMLPQLATAEHVRSALSQLHGA